MSAQLIYKSISFKTALEAWKPIAKSLVFNEYGDVLNSFTGKKLLVSSVESFLRTCRTASFNFRLGEGGISYTQTFSKGVRYDQYLFLDLYKSQQEAEGDIKALFLDPNFLEARLFDKDFDRLQNETEIYFYEKKGVPLDSLKMRSNGFPPPLEKTIVDVSSNPCRTEYGDNVVGFIGSTMWFGSSFWEISKSSQDEVKNLDWITFHASENYCKVQLADRLIQKEQDIDKYKVQQFRECLYGNCTLRLPSVR